ncbi:crossover junction endodeoxyribonuclease RuvC [Methyloligella sp. 2.7D]|uniref:crossover junction endodeoxyribonuclease RuvC n=1 Tax=unclassified Methyloligella TaxID=2625955 RepID=UPI00157DAAAA|nr:crossover junction endodeoxyribonuclease RuvC [Methyloligella sp. GL2]QKP76828.1 crossover junction endodeoxyribonuclease RuvC [Methyloligella sp. GL2]
MAVIRIIGIDPGLRHTGWGIIESDGPRLSYVASGTVSSEARDDLSVRLCQLFDGLNATLREWTPHEAAAEETFVNKDARATLKLGQARGIALLVPALTGIVVAEYAPNLVKKSVVGNGHGGKEQVRAMIRHLLPKASPDSEHATDALAIAITHAHHRTAVTARLTRGELQGALR